MKTMIETMLNFIPEIKSFFIVMLTNCLELIEVIALARAMIVGKNFLMNLEGLRQHWQERLLS